MLYKKKAKLLLIQKTFSSSMMYHCHEMHFLSCIFSAAFCISVRCKFLKTFAIKDLFLWQNPIFNQTYSLRKQDGNWQRSKKEAPGKKCNFQQRRRQQPTFWSFWRRRRLLLEATTTKVIRSLNLSQSPSFGRSTRHYSSATGRLGKLQGAHGEEAELFALYFFVVISQVFYSN